MEIDENKIHYIPFSSDELNPLLSKINTNENNIKAANKELGNKLNKDTFASPTTAGIAKISNGLKMTGDNNDAICIAKATEEQIREGTETYNPIVPANASILMNEYGLDSKNTIGDMKNSIDTHKNDTVNHITSDERTTWNNKPNADEVISTGQGDEIIDAINNIAKAQSTSKEHEKLIDNLKRDLDAQTSRIDNLSTLEEGSTTGDAELQDIRVGADGTIYASAGEAVRGQVNELKEDLDTLFEFYYPVEHGTFNSNGKSGTNSNRIRTDFIKVNKGQSISIKNGNLEHACGMWKDSIIDSNCIRNDTKWCTDYEEINCEYDGYLIVIYRNKSNTDISLSDFDGEIKLQKNSQIFKNRKDIDELKRKTSLYSSKNICGIDSNILYPVDLKIGDILTLSTSDSSNVEERFNICLFDENKKRVDEFSLSKNTNKRTIELIKDAKYITWRKKSNIPLQVERGDTATSYEEYIYQQNELKSIIDKGYYELTPFTNGSWAGNKLTVDNTKRLRLQDFVRVKSGDKITIKNGSLYHAVGLWNSSMNNYRNDTKWRTDDEEIYIEYDGHAIIVFAKPTDEDISCNDFDGEIKLYNIYGSEKEEEIIVGNDELIIGNKKNSCL